MMGKPKTAPNWPGLVTGERGTFHIFGFELFVAGALAEVGDAALKSEEVEVSGVFEDGNDQSPIERDGDSDVDRCDGSGCCRLRVMR
jgi:hypothetical protein